MAQCEVAFDWPYPAGDVILTGDFDNWAKSMHLAPSGSGFKGTVKLPHNSAVHYKFIVDGEWRLRDDLPQEANDVGIVNNVIQTPEATKGVAPTEPAKAPSDMAGAPVIVAVAQEVIAPTSSEEPAVSVPQVEAPRPIKEPAPVPVISASVDTAKDVVNAAHEFVNGINGPSPTITPDDAERPPESALPPSGYATPGETSSVSPLAIDPVISPTEEATAETPTLGIKQAPEEPPPSKEPSLLTSVASNVASNVGLALKSLTGIDPINPNKIPIPPDTASPPAPFAIQGPIAKDVEPAATRTVVEPTPGIAPAAPTMGKGSSKFDSSSTKSFPTIGSSYSTPTNGGTRQKRQSFFGKVKNLFSHSHNHNGKHHSNK